MAKLYVGNLPRSVTEARLEEFFATSQYQVDNIKLIRDMDTGLPRGFAFVELAAGADVEKAVQETNVVQRILPRVVWFVSGRHHNTSLNAHRNIHETAQASPLGFGDNWLGEVYFCSKDSLVLLIDWLTPDLLHLGSNGNLY